MQRTQSIPFSCQNHPAWQKDSERLLCFLFVINSIIKYLLHHQPHIIPVSVRLPVPYNELLKKEITGHVYPEETTCRYTGYLDKGELTEKEISEMGLYDAEGDMIAYRTFRRKGKEGAALLLQLISACPVLFSLGCWPSGLPE